MTKQQCCTNTGSVWERVNYNIGGFPRLDVLRSMFSAFSVATYVAMNRIQ